MPIKTCEDFDLSFGMEIEFTSALDKDRIRSFYQASTYESAQLGHEFDAIERLIDSNLRSFVLYRNAISCFANGLESSLMLELFHNSKQLHFVVTERGRNSWSFNSTSAFVETKYFKMSSGLKTFNLELNEEWLKKLFRSRDETIALIQQDGDKINLENVVLIDQRMEINWERDEIKLTDLQPTILAYVSNDEKTFVLDESANTSMLIEIEQKPKHPSAPPASKNLLQQLFMQGYQKRNALVLRCLYPNCSFEATRLKLKEHYIEHDTSNQLVLKVLRRNHKSIVKCCICKQMVEVNQLNEHFETLSSH